MVKAGAVEDLGVDIVSESQALLDQFGYPKLFLELDIGGIDKGGVAHAATGQTVFGHAGITVCATMVGGEEQQIVVAPDAFIQQLDKMGEFLVKLMVDGVNFG